jgi:poly(A) polymerase
VGSAVRNTLLKEPIHDYDIATTHLPEGVEQLCAAANIKTVPTGRQYGTLTVLCPPHTYEVTSLRRDIRTDGRHAQVSFTPHWQEDAARRDFTMNSLYLDQGGNLYDFHDGLKDLQAGRVRFIGNPSERIQEDFLRILRFFRFSAFYGHPPLDPEGLKACVGLRAGLGRLSRERITAETLRLLQAPVPWTVLDVLVRENFLPLMTGLQAPFFQEALPRLGGLARLEEAIGEPMPPLLRLKALLASPSPLLPGLRLTRQQQKAWSHPPEDATVFLDLVEKVAVAYLTPQAGAEEWKAWQKRFHQQQAHVFPLKGQDLLKLGVPAGPVLGELLKDLESWWRQQDPPPPRSPCLQQAKQRMTSAGLAIQPTAEET